MELWFWLIAAALSSIVIFALIAFVRTEPERIREDVVLRVSTQHPDAAIRVKSVWQEMRFFDGTAFARLVLVPEDEQARVLCEQLARELDDVTVAD